MAYKDKEQQREYQRQWMADRRKASLASLGDACVKCGSSEKLELDHINPKEKVTHRIVSWTREKQVGELKKCQLLCERCHREKTTEEIRKHPNERGEYECSKCHAFYPPDGFHKTHSRILGISNACKICRNAQSRLRDRRKDKSLPNPRLQALANL